MTVAAVHTSSSWRAFGKLYFFFLYFSLVYQGLVWLSGSAGSTGVRQSIYMSLIWLVPLLYWPAATRVYSAVVGIVLWAVSVMCLGYFAVYGQEFSQSVIYIIFESNLAEGSEYLGNYFRWWMVPALVLYSVLPLWLWFRLEQPAFTLTRTRTLSASIMAFTIALPFGKPLMLGMSLEDGLISLENRMEPASPWQIAIGYVKYRQQLAAMNRLLSINTAVTPLKHFDVRNPEAPSTVVLVIGESTSRAHMSLYDYGRETNPKLGSIRDQLVVFNQVFSPRPYTIESLEQALTFANQKEPDLYLSKPNLLNIMRQAGYRIYWITNQQTLTKRNTMLTTFSQQADEQVYLNNNRMQNAKQYDEAVIEPFKQVLAGEAKRKFIIVHLLGTHMQYQYRYPESFAYFKDRSGVPDWIRNDELESYNAYDNAVRYNDEVVYQLIQNFGKTDPDGFLVYFSDHGEEVYDDSHLHFNGRNEAAPTPGMYTIPFVVWISPHWSGKPASELSRYADRLYSTSYFLHAWVDLCSIRFDEWQPEKSFFSERFVDQPVLVGNPNKQGSLRDVRTLGWVKPSGVVEKR